MVMDEAYGKVCVQFQGIKIDTVNPCAIVHVWHIKVYRCSCDQFTTCRKLNQLASAAICIFVFGYDESAFHCLYDGRGLERTLFVLVDGKEFLLGY